VNNLVLLHLGGSVELQQLALHPLIIEQFHAVLLVEIDKLDLMVLLLDIIIVICGRIITKFDLVILSNNLALSIVMLLSICLICTGSQIHRFLSEIDRFH
jgi:hypothetical protein